MNLRRLAPTVGICLALLVASPTAHAEPTDDPSSSSEPSPTAEPSPSQTEEPSPAPAPEPTSTPSPSPTPTSTSTPTTSTPPQQPAPTPTSTPQPTSSSISTSTTQDPRTSSHPSSPTQRPGSSSQATYTSPPNPWSGGSTQVETPLEPAPLAPADLAAQLAQADELLASLSAGNSQLAALLAELDELTTAANEALEAKAAADAAAESAASRAERSKQTAERMAQELERKHQLLREWAFAAYTDGGSTAEMVSVFDALLNDPAKAGNPVGDLAYLTEQRITLFEDIRHLTARQEEVAQRAASDARLTTTTAAAAEAARVKADEAVQAQKDLIAKAEEDQVALLVDAAPMAMLLGMASPEAQARGQAIVDALLERNLDLPDIDKPCSNDTALYPNGQLPASALCPLWEAPGHFARPDAAVAFNALSQKFARDFGQPICVTSSYRSFSQQVAVKARRGFWAATPGYSQHGLGKALDLCGGINNFGTIEHLWMKQNAPLFGWFHPSWARAGGNKPEPWHWEFAG